MAKSKNHTNHNQSKFSTSLSNLKEKEMVAGVMELLKWLQNGHPVLPLSHEVFKVLGESSNLLGDDRQFKHEPYNNSKHKSSTSVPTLRCNAYLPYTCLNIWIKRI